MKKTCYEKRAQVVLKNLRSRHFDAYYCATKEDVLRQALSLIPEGASVGWGGSVAAEEVGLIDGAGLSSFRCI